MTNDLLFSRCKKDNGKCGVGGYCDQCPYTYDAVKQNSQRIIIDSLKDNIVFAAIQWKKEPSLMTLRQLDKCIDLYEKVINNNH